MRKCLVQYFIPGVREEYTTETGNKAVRTQPGTGCFSEWTEGWFHGWGVEGDEGSTTSCAIVELEDGSVVFGYIGATPRFKFIPKPPLTPKEVEQMMRQLSKTSGNPLDIK